MNEIRSQMEWLRELCRTGLIDSARIGEEKPDDWINLLKRYFKNH